MKRVKLTLNIDKGETDIDVLVTASGHDEQVQALMARIADPLAGTLIVLDAQGLSVPLAEEAIVSIAAENKRLRVITDDGRYQMRSTLQELEEQLNPSSFLRISRYEIINLGKVRRFDFSTAGSLRIEMSNGNETWASRRYIQAIRSRLQGRG